MSNNDYEFIQNLFGLSKRAIDVIRTSGLEFRIECWTYGLGEYDSDYVAKIMKAIENPFTHGRERVTYVDVTNEIMSIMAELGETV